MKLAKVQSKIAVILTQPSPLELDDKAKMDRVPEHLRLEFEKLQEQVKTVILNDLDPQNANSDAYRQAQAMRYETPFNG